MNATYLLILILGAVATTALFAIRLKKEQIGAGVAFLTTLLGAVLGFLWFNAKPAQIFMGDTGSLAFGGTLGIVACMLKCEFAFAIAGCIFVMETLSDIIQVVYFKATHGKRIFKMAPIHHHFIKSGWSETQVVIRFWIISIFSHLGRFVANSDVTTQNSPFSHILSKCEISSKANRS